MKAIVTGAKNTGTKTTGDKVTEAKKNKKTKDEKGATEATTKVTRTKEEDVDGNSVEENVPKDENEDDVPKGQTDKSLKMKAGTGKRSGLKAYDDTPLPEEDDEDSVDEDDDAEDQRPGEKARSSKDEKEIRKKAEADEDARYQRRLELLMQQDEQIQKAKRDQDKESRRNQKDDALKVGDANDEALAEHRTVGEAEAGSNEQSSSKPSPKTQRKPRVKGPEEEMSPIIQKMVDEEVEKRLKAKQSLTRRLFQEECDEEDAKTPIRREYEKDETSLRENEKNQSRERCKNERTVRNKS